MDIENVFRVIIVGDTGVGKSCILLRFSENSFKEEHNVTIGVEFAAKTIIVENRQVKLQIWDTAGQESFRSVTKSFYRRADGVILVYDVTTRQTFNNCDYWVEEIRQFASSGTPIVLVGNLVDLVQNHEEERQVEKQEGSDLAEKYKLLGFLEISAKSGLLVDETFSLLANGILQKKVIRHKNSSILDPELHPRTKKKKKKKCC